MSKSKSRESSLLNPVSSGLSGLVVGMKVVGVITRVESYGVFVRIDNTKVTGLAHITECSDGLQKSLTGIYNPGDKVKALILSVDLDANRLSLGLKPSYFQSTTVQEQKTIQFATLQQVLRMKVPMAVLTKSILRLVAT